MAHQLPPLPQPNVLEFDNDSMQPVWRVFWQNLLIYIKALPNGATLAASPSYANDAAAALGGVKVGEFYRSGSQVMVRVV